MERIGRRVVEGRRALESMGYGEDMSLAMEEGKGRYEILLCSSSFLFCSCLD